MSLIKLNFKKKLSYIIIFLLTVSILFVLLTISAKIPLSAIKDNLEESAEFLKKKPSLYMTNIDKPYSYIHLSADAKKLEIIYSIDSDKPVESVLWSKYYRGKNESTNKSLFDLVNNSKIPNRQYLRYWNGSMLILRPLLIYFNMEQIYIINAFLLIILLFTLFTMLLKRSKKVAFIFLFSLFSVAVWYVLSIEYSVTFYIMMIASMIALKIDENKKEEPQSKVNEKLSKLFLITGIVTTFFDFLTTELLTIFVPILLILIIRNEEKRLSNFKNTLRLVLKFSILWFIGYCGMWLAKWILSALILNINAFEYVKENAVERINGLSALKTNSYTYLYGQAILKNLYALPIINLIHLYFYKISIKILTILLLLIPLLLVKWNNLKNKKNLLIFLLIGITPYIRYLLLANHSEEHAYFTFRIQIITIMSFIYVIIKCLNYELIKKIALFFNIKINNDNKTTKKNQ